MAIPKCVILFIKQVISWAWRHMPLVTALERQVDFWVLGQPGLQRKFHDSQSYTEISCLNKTKPTKQTETKQNWLVISPSLQTCPFLFIQFGSFRFSEGHFCKSIACALAHSPHPLPSHTLSHTLVLTLVPSVPKTISSAFPSSEHKWLSVSETPKGKNILLFQDWLKSPHMAMSNCIHLASDDITSFCFVHEKSFAYINHAFLIPFI